MSCPKRKSQSNSSDLISNLPDPIISHILSFLPIPVAVATCLLSTKWNNHWTNLHTLTFDDNSEPFGCFGHPDGEMPKKIKFAGFVNRVLHLHRENSLVKFYLHCMSNSDIYDIIKWVSISIMKGVRELDLSVLSGGSGHIRDAQQLVRLPPCCFNSTTLEVLRLANDGIIIKVPNVVYLPNLTRLVLNEVEYEGGEYARKLISCCTSLEYLDISILVPRLVGPYIISSSSLRYLTYNGNGSVQFLNFLEEGPSIITSSDIARTYLCCKKLEELRLYEVLIKGTYCLPNVRVLNLYDVQFENDESASNLLSSLPSIKSLVIVRPIDMYKLKISSSTLSYLSVEEVIDNDYTGLELVLDAPILQHLKLSSWLLKEVHGHCNVRILSVSHLSMRDTIPEHKFPKFPKVTELTVGVECSGFPLMQQLIKNSTALEDLTIVFKKYSFEETNCRHILSWKDPEIVPGSLLLSFQRLYAYGFEGLENELAMVEYLLKNTRVLQEMVIEIRPSLDNDTKINLLQKLLKFRRASEECEMTVCSDGSMSKPRKHRLRFPDWT